MWLAAIASWPNPESPAAQVRAERCYDKYSFVAPSPGVPARRVKVANDGPATLQFPTIDIAKQNSDQLAIIAVAVLALLFIWKKA